MLCFGLSASADNNKLDFSDLNYVFDYSIDKCKAQEFKFKSSFSKNITMVLLLLLIK